MIKCDSSQIQRIVESVWTSVLNLDVEHLGSSGASRGGKGTMAACVQITGAWHGAVVLDCSYALARRAAAIMFGVEEHVASDDEIRDAIGELTNIIGGKLKAQVSGSCRLSLPTVVEGEDWHLSIRASRLLEEARFDCCGEVVRVAVYQSPTSTALGPTTEARPS